MITYGVSGNRDRSFYPKNSTRYVNEGTLNYNLKTESGTIQQGKFQYRSTDDETIDPKDFSIESLYFRFNNQKVDAAFGDTFVLFSEYSLSNSLKGIKSDFKLDNGAKFIVTAGVDTSTWDNLYTERKDDDSSKRYVWGSRFENNYLASNNLTVGFNYAGAADDNATVTDVDTAKHIQVISSDLRWKINKALSFRSEVAKSFRKARTGEGITYDDKFDNAYSAAFDLLTAKQTSTIAYKRAGSNFETTGGFSAQGLENIQVNNSFNVTNKFHLNSFLYLSRDNLDKHKETTLRQINPGIGFIADLPQQFSLRGGWNLRKEKATDDSSDNRTHTLTIGVSKLIGSVSTALDYSRSYFRDDVNADQERNRDDISLNFSGNFNIKLAQISWYLSEICAFEKNRFYDDRDILLSHLTGVTMKFPKELYVTVNLTMSDNNYYQDANDSDIQNYEFSIHKIINDNFSVSANLTQNDNTFTDENNDFSERKLIVKMAYKF